MSLVESIVVTAAEMREIEEAIFAGGMPVAALMEKAALLVAERIIALTSDFSSLIGVLVGPGHNGGDALVVARELYLKGYDVAVYCPFDSLKDLTAQHSNYGIRLGIPFVLKLEDLQGCDFIIDGLFGFGLERELSGRMGEEIDRINSWRKIVISIDLPSGIHTDTGKVLGTAIKASHTLCLGLWKRAFFQDHALEYIGEAQRIDFGITESQLPANISTEVITPDIFKNSLPLPRHPLTHKYKQGHVLLVCGSERYAGGAILTGLGARGSGVGMLSMAVPLSFKPLLVNHLPEALIIGCEETPSGVIASLPPLDGYDIIACGPGLTTENPALLQKVLGVECPLILDADALNLLAKIGVEVLKSRKGVTVLTPHAGEFKRLFQGIDLHDRILATQQAASISGAIVLLKGARTVIAHPDGTIWLIGESTPALARGGSGDVLTGLMGGLLSQMTHQPVEKGVALSAHWHARAAILAASQSSEMGVDGVTLAQYLTKIPGSF
ncbi:MAG: Bifunctional NAD(P)H-hydrate repair enzyme Nnr [Chroococcopsis gigantea SAG 12.99]|jgi:hydroxyethylthiazole kinase-like uncharacterized protein yjeF|nr:NAD(P)H-hydrate dehydratase [Chlorogloea purpurea SAG 13.99]MDV2999220.1 Bifunctional NAD(P)H-hydrate repair enzyme Nnr [Chroococcopsis gigantea SAG 12.99]